jgi:hypothetical protein
VGLTVVESEALPKDDDDADIVLSDVSEGVFVLLGFAESDSVFVNNEDNVFVAVTEFCGDKLGVPASDSVSEDGQEDVKVCDCVRVRVALCETLAVIDSECESVADMVTSAEPDAVCVSVTLAGLVAVLESVQSIVCERDRETDGVIVEPISRITSVEAENNVTT